MREPARLLLIQLYHLGDVILATPAIRAARAAFPDSRIDFLTGRLGAQALEGNPHLDNIITDDIKPRTLRQQYDAVADMHSVPRTARFTLATHAAQRIGIRGRGPRNWFYTSLVEREPGPVYMGRQKMRLLSPVGVDVSRADARLEIAINDADREFARALFEQHGLDGKVVAVSPVAKHEFKQWGFSRWSAVADALAESGARILITSGPGEEEQARAVAGQMKQPAVWQYGRTTVRQLAALYERCVLWIGNDGGPKHIATAAGTPTFSVVRRNLGRVWNDEGDPAQRFVEAPGESLDSITVESVVGGVL